MPSVRNRRAPTLADTGPSFCDTLPTSSRVSCEPYSARAFALSVVGGLDGRHIHDAADRLTAPQHGLRAAQHFDARDVADQEIPEIEATARR